MSNSSLLRPLVLALGLILATAVFAGVYDDIIAAANKDDTAQVIDLLKRGMDVNTADPSGNTLLMIAARNGNAELLEFLLANRANALKKNKFGDSAIMLATFRGYAGIVQKLLKAGIDTRGTGWNALHYAAYGGYADIARMLLDHKADPDALAPNGQTALMLAARNGKLDIVKILVDADADMDIEDYEGRTAIMLAEGAGQAEVVEYLREEGAYE